MDGFLPVSRADMKTRGIDQLDFIYICGDAYVDHPSFGHAIITRVLDDMGFSVGIIAQPDVSRLDDFTKLGAPRLGVMVSSGNIDSMVNHYTAAKRRRSEDLYSPGGKAGLRPDRAVNVYCKMAREAFGSLPIIIGGIEASLRRFAHYDYWDDAVRASILEESGADLLIYGMGERQIREIALHLKNGKVAEKIRDVKGTCYLADDVDALLATSVLIPSFSEVTENKRRYAEAFMTQKENQDPVTGKRLIQKQRRGYLVQNPPPKPLSVKEMDAVYALPYQRTYHPMYEKDGGIPAIREVEFSITAQRGCFGGCSFCALTYHQGRMVASRSDESILAEAKAMTQSPGFKGYIHDVGGPTANFHQPACEKQKKSGVCKDRQCLFPTPCKNMKVSHEGYLKLLQKLRALPGVKKVFIRSGIRFDYLMKDPDDCFFQELVEHHVSGQLKVAPEHISNTVLHYMGKPQHHVYEAFSDKFYRMCKRVHKEQYLVPYLMSSHPGSGLKEAVELALYLKQNRLTPQQVQDFYPTPSTLSTCMYYTGIDPRDGKHVYVARTPEEKAMQRALLQYKNPKNYELVKAALLKIGRIDLIGNGPQCLIRLRPGDSLPEESRQRDASRQESGNGQRRGKRGARSQVGRKDAEKRLNGANESQQANKNNLSDGRNKKPGGTEKPMGKSKTGRPVSNGKRPKKQGKTKPGK